MFIDPTSHLTDTLHTAKFLLDKGIPSDIIDLPRQMLATPIGQSFLPMLQSQQARMTEFYAQNGGDANPLEAMLQTPPTTAPTAPVENKQSPDENKQPIVFKTQKHAAQATRKLIEFTASLSLSPAESNVLSRCPDALAAADGNTLLAIAGKLDNTQKFVALDLLRPLLLADDAVVAADSALLVDTLVAAAAVEARGTARMALRCLANLFHSQSRIVQLLENAHERQDAVLTCICQSLARTDDAQAAAGAAACAVNFALHSGRLSDDTRTQLTTACVDAVGELAPDHAGAPLVLRALLAVCSDNSDMCALVGALEPDLARHAKCAASAPTLAQLLVKLGK
eukprot:TRINITY_DN534_c0_g1_i1.p2 TRINITY_DN534_c0_g1~~TRINITY_DN534_c0_g1_i1.p2  ORF type:complete len:340 (-),score=138.51 TRINITY_DN534_c0_g1_i1:3-1022(-)